MQTIQYYANSFSTSIYNYINPLSNDMGISINQHEFFQQLDQWENDAHPDEEGDRHVAAMRIHTAYETGSRILDLQDMKIKSLPILPDTVEDLNLNGCVHLVKTVKSDIINRETADAIGHTVTAYSQRIGGLMGGYLAYCFLLYHANPESFDFPNMLHSRPPLPEQPSLLPLSSGRRIMNATHNLSDFNEIADNLPQTLRQFDIRYPLVMMFGLYNGYRVGKKMGSLLSHVITRLPLPMLQEHAITPNLPEPLPKNLKRLCLRGIPFEVIKVPHALEQLDVSHCRLLRRVSALENPLQRLDVTGCISLWELPTQRPHELQVVGFIPAEDRASLEKWYRKAGKTPQQLVELNQIWQDLRTEVGFDQFQTLLERMAEDVLCKVVKPQQVVDIIDEVVQAPAIRPILFSAAFEAAQDCHDRVLLIFDNIRALAKASALQRTGASDKEILEFAIGMVKQALLDEAVPRIMNQQWKDNRRHGNHELDGTGAIANNGRGSGPNMREALEVQLALRHQLGQTLNLPFLVDGMLFERCAGLNKDDKRLAMKYVEMEIKNQNGLIERLVAQPMWTHFIIQRFAEEIQSIKERYEQAMTSFEEANAKGLFKKPEAYFISELNQLVLDLENDIQSFLKAKTQTLLLEAVD